MPDYKVYIFVNCFYLSDAEREVIDRKVKRDGRMAIWLYASGFANPDADVRMSADNITSLTDIHTICDPHCSFTTFRLTGAHPALSRVDADRLYGRFDRKIESNVWLRQTAQITYAYPLFTTDDPDAQVLGRFCNTGLPALVIKEMPAYTSVFCGAKVLRADILQSLLAYAGCHIWNDSTDDVLYANDHFVVLHAASAGEKTLHLPVQTDVYEVYEKRFYGQGTAAISFPMRRGETKMFSLCGEC